MSFQIKDSTGNLLTMKQLDTEAAEFWKKEINPKYYASPTDSMWSTNWFDSIGYNIHSPNTREMKNWGNVKDSLLFLQLSGFMNKTVEEQLEKLKEINVYLKPYIELINHWESKGYTPIQIKE